MRSGCFLRSTSWRRRSPGVVVNAKKQKERKISYRLARDRHASEMYRAGGAKQPARRCRPTTCNADVSCDGSLSFACGVCAWRFSLCVFSLENPYREKLSSRRSEPERKHCFSRMANGFAKEARHVFQECASQFCRPEYDCENGKRAGVKAGAIHAFTYEMESGWWDLNPRPPRPERGALPS